jgi:hypothetical protein
MKILPHCGRESQSEVTIIQVAEQATWMMLKARVPCGQK